MITRLYQSLIAAAAVLFLSAASAQETQKEIDGEGWFDRMSKALTSLNFEASLVHVHGDLIEPYQWFQAVGEPQSQELLIRMNGPDFRILRVVNRVAHFHTSASNYSLRADSVSAILPEAFTKPFANLKDTYQVTIGGGARVLGRNAQHLRV
ncbi:MAG: negative regulator of sigma E activity, partial [Idiomarina sp.]|nr:negative regulator of sigma E activity [Idiomarina sp.]